MATTYQGQDEAAYRTELTGDDGGARRRDVSWDDEVVPTLRKRLESESAFLSKRLSNPKPTPSPSPPQHQPQWHRPTPTHAYRPSQDLQPMDPYSSPVHRSPVVGSKIPVPAHGSARSRRKASETNGGYSFPKSDEEDFGGRFVGESSSGGDGEVSETDGGPSPSRNGPRTRTKSTPLAFSKQPVNGAYSTTPPHPTHITPPTQLLDLPPNRYKPRTPSPTDALLSSASNTSSPNSNTSPKVRTVALPYPPTRIPAPARSRSGSASSNTRLGQAALSGPPLPRSVSGGSMSLNGTPHLDEDDPWSETEVIRSDRMIRDEVAPFRILSPELVVPGAGGRLELGKVDTFTERELMRQQQGSGRREMLDIAIKGHSKAVAGGGSIGKVEEVELKDHDGGSSSHSPVERANGSSPTRRRVNSAAGINGHSPSQSSSTPNTPNGRQASRTNPQPRKASSPGPMLSLDPPRTPRVSTTKSPNGTRKVSTSATKPRSVTKSFSADVRSTTPDEEMEIGGYRLSTFGPDSIPPPSQSKMDPKSWDTQIIPAARKLQKAPNPLDKWEEMGPAEGSPLKGKSSWNGEQPHRLGGPSLGLGNGRPIFNDTTHDPQTENVDFGDRQMDGQHPPTSNGSRPPPLQPSNSNGQLRPPMASALSSTAQRNGHRPPNSPAPFSGGGWEPQTRQPGRVEQPGPGRSLQSQQQHPGKAERGEAGGEEGKSKGCCGCSIM